MNLWANFGPKVPIFENRVNYKPKFTHKLMAEFCFKVMGQLYTLKDTNKSLRRIDLES